MKRLLTAATSAVCVLVGTVAVAGGATALAASTPPALAAIRVDQVGYAFTESKRAYLLAPHAVAGTRFTVRDRNGRALLTGTVEPSTGRWNSRYGAVHPIDFTGLYTPGTYTIEAAGVVSPRFRVAYGWELFAPLAQDAVSFFTVQRDGANVIPGPLDRKPSHLTDAHATVYDTPVFTGDGGDVPAAPLKAIGGPVDVEGGWFDAGDFVKFTHNSAYALAELLYTQREPRTANPALAAEAGFGMEWLDKMWDAQHKVLYVQVGIGTGSDDFGFLGDHDVWRLPEADDALRTKAGDKSYFLKYRPVFTAAPAGQPISPNLAGRVSAAFALAAQVAVARGDWTAARHWLDEASSVFAQAKTTGVGELVTAFPHAYYPETSWADDLEFGAAELARAAQVMGDGRGDGWLRDAAHWASVYLASSTVDTLNLYDTSALAHTDLITAMRAGHSGALAVTERQLVVDLKRQLDTGVRAAARQPFGQAVDVTAFDAATRSFGYSATAALYRSVTGDGGYNNFGTRQRNFALGANGWGASLMIGEGTDFPLCPQHQVANLSGSLTGGHRVIKGAVVNGPNGADNFTDLGSMPDGARNCPADDSNRFAPFDRTDARFLDDVRAWPSVEPAIDFTATGTLALSLNTLVP